MTLHAPDPLSTQGADSPPLLHVENLCKQFPGVRALHQVRLHLLKGEVLAVIGENGAGKSTLMKILAGIQSPDQGRIVLDGAEVQIDSVRTAQRLGIALIHQELNLADNLSIAANIFLGREPLRFGLVDQDKIDTRSRRVMDQVGLNCPPGELVNRLSLGRQQMVEIAKALSADARILIMDEPTSSLSQRETEQLFKVINDLRHRGVSVLYISHRLGEVRQLADRVVVLRDGENAGELPRDMIDHERMVQLMVGRDIAQFYQRTRHLTQKTVLHVENLRTPTHPIHPIHLTVRAGEIVGLAGLVGAGRTELLRCLFGIDRPESGLIRLHGEPLNLTGPIDAINAGIALVPEDRKQQGLILEMAVRHNLSLASLRRDQRQGFLNRAREAELATEMIHNLNIRTPGPEQISQFLSGGNQQKIVLGKWLALRPGLLLLDEPTRGIDVGAKQEIYGLMEQLAQKGVAILFVSSEMEEILHMSDRVLVMHEGRLTGELAAEDVSEESVMRLATGGRNLASQ